ncbi:hypothetical protein ACE193_07035 [Bernardetia sp. OM2101]|uniref:hypothetical protein n=1 Tax=Bernardetia sp. OM2101 TaxID=3344876 RepID=UPI0035CF7DA3
MRKFYTPELEELIQLHYSRLSEKDKHHYATLETEKLGYGGKTYISILLSISRPTLDKGLLELKAPSLYEQIPSDKQRRDGGGRKKNLSR